MKDRIESVLTIIFLMLIVLEIFGAFTYQHSELDDIQRIQEQLREEKLSMGGW